MDNRFSKHQQVRIVSTFSELVKTNFYGKVNAICWQRELEGNFEEIVSQLQLKENITEITIDDLKALNLSEKGNNARETILNDMKNLTDFGALPSLNLLKSYERDNEFDFISTDVYSFHIDRSPIGTDTYLCTYYGTSSDIIPNDKAEQKILVPAIREKLRELHDGAEDEFETFLQENYFDLHYQAKPNAKSINLGVGNLWRLAVDHPEQQVLPCVHRAPKENDNEYRLLLIC
ncbi:DUF1826 domain-containing protein [Empedobacter brevis]|uniref:DUF1826 domain-containing protein n=1 Tax=Empedobacter brevis TaxID=247 RepID=UPI0023F19DC9|nr:DUF1826 domain-containing protein [Empedobacter brevis]